MSNVVIRREAAVGGHIKEGRADVVANVTRQDTSTRRLSQLFYPYLYLSTCFTSRVRSACTPPGYPAATIFRKVGEGFEILILNLYFRSIFQFKFVSIPRD